MMEKRQKVACRNQDSVCILGEALRDLSYREFADRIPLYNRRCWKTNEETPSPLWFSIPTSSNPVETSFPESSSEAPDSRPWRDKGARIQSSQTSGVGRITLLSILDTTVSGVRWTVAGGSLSAWAA